MYINYQDIGSRIREQRLKQNLTQQALAELADLTPTNISHIERGATKLSLPSLINIANALSVSADTFLCDSVQQSKHIFENEIVDLIKECDQREIRVLSESMKTLLKSLRKVYDVDETNGK
jgi:transcriptional regulator with XRE-family HTH domain